MLIPDPRRTPLPNLISHNGIILYQWEFLRARLDEGEGLPWIAMDIHVHVHEYFYLILLLSMFLFQRLTEYADDICEAA